MISIVSPVYNSENCVEELVKRIIFSTKKISNRIEIILVDDGSTDNSWDKIKELKKKFKFIKGIKLNKNHGQHQAIYVGICNSFYDITIVLDCDLQDDPRYIPLMYKSYLENRLPVIIQHSYEDFDFKSRIVSNFFWYFLSIISLKKFTPYLGNYLLIDKGVKKKYLKIKKIGYLYGDLIIQKNVFFVIKKKRSKGIRKESSYNFQKLINLAIRLILKYNIFNRIFINNKKNLNGRKYIEIEI
jgi:glycosyltransferase involved in cell wall biosynthesis